MTRDAGIRITRTRRITVTAYEAARLARRRIDRRGFTAGVTHRLQDLRGTPHSGRSIARRAVRGSRCDRVP